MNRVLILFAHPRYEESRTNQVLVKAIPRTEAITFHDLYELYPDFNIDVETEKQLLLEHDIVIWHHPLYWYSAPPLVKQWIDLVLEFKWAYGPGGDALKGKMAFNAVTSGGPREAYQQNSRNRFTLQEFLRPFEQTVRLCHMTYLPPFAVQGTHRLTESNLEQCGLEYRQILQRFTEREFNTDEILKHEYLQDWLMESKTLES